MVLIVKFIRPQEGFMVIIIANTITDCEESDNYVTILKDLLQHKQMTKSIMCKTIVGFLSFCSKFNRNGESHCRNLKEQLHNYIDI